MFSLALREARKAKARQDCETSGGHYWIDDGLQAMPDGKGYPKQVCKCGATRLLPI